MGIVKNRIISTVIGEITNQGINLSKEILKNKLSSEINTIKPNGREIFVDFLSEYFPEFMIKNSYKELSNIRNIKKDVLYLGKFYHVIDRYNLMIVNNIYDIINGTRIHKLSIMFIGKDNKKLFKNLKKYFYKKRNNPSEYIRVANDATENISLLIDKSFDDIFTKNKQNIIRAIDNWSSQETFFIKHGIPYKLGILLYGESGTGKTTLIKAIATKYRRDIIILNPSTFDLDRRNVYNFNNRIIVIEDLDCYVSARDKNTIINNNMEYLSNQKIGKLLNLLDGLESFSNVIFIATTNHIDRIDEAILRTGRFDFKFHIGLMEKPDALKMCKRFETDSSILDEYNFPIKPSDLQTKILENKKIGVN